MWSYLELKVTKNQERERKKKKNKKKKRRIATRDSMEKYGDAFFYG